MNPMLTTPRSQKAAKLLSLILSAGLLCSLLLVGCTPLSQYDYPPEGVLQQVLVEDFKQRKSNEHAITTQVFDNSSKLPRWTELRPPLSPGDRIRVSVFNGDNFSGLFEIDIDGAINIPFLPSLNIAGHGVTYAEKQIVDALVKSGQFRPERVWVSVRVQQWAPVQVYVSGAVFSPGMVTVNVRKPDDRAQKSLQDSGDFPPERLLPAALRGAGGVRPDAAVHSITLIRNGTTQVIDFSGIVDGIPIQPIPLMSGDSIVVPATGVMDRKLLTTSAITAPGIRVFLSNLTVPARGNAISAISKDATSLPYGSRLINGLTSANCFGGTNTTNASRHAVLVRTNPLNGRQETVTRSFEDLLEHPDDDDVNLFLMPNDSIGCYDSSITNLRDLAKTLQELLAPFSIF